MNSHMFLTALLIMAPQEPPAASREIDANRIRWVRPFKEALQRARGVERLVFTKPILGGSNTPKPGGQIAGGKNDCDGSW